ncbi:MAG TPA: dTDP-4-dehydrorhamnose 3,5-epimerase [Thermoanaerobaculia bacterium]|jgi:dTDP-4-dehydrorhamnose 3,5-epimerase|nr:dTDP-4-dehydrorhamnose 3,5-epimerase [Thermoanaerobaculia bacterium]
MSPADSDLADNQVLAAARRDEGRSEEPDAVVVRRINGVLLRRLPGHHDHRGGLFPFLDTSDPFWREPVVHGYVFTVRPGRIKGWGMHRRQADRYFVATGDVRVVLYDGREGSPDRGNFCELYFTAGREGLVYIPQGVWHATQNFGKTVARIVNLPTVRFDAADPDKYRVDPHGGEIPFDWRLRDG